MSDKPDNEDPQAAQLDLDVANNSQGTSRRKFARNALTGGAVIFSLGNRSAWAQDTTSTCVETDLLVSAIAPLNSVNPLTLEDEANLQKILESDPEQVYQTGKDTCVDPDENPETLSWGGYLEDGWLNKSSRQKDAVMQDFYNNKNK